MDPNITNPIYDDPNKVTCKVVKRKGQKGARIYPKGCKVRTEVDRAGNIVNRFTDKGLKKMTIKSQRSDYRMKISNFNNTFTPADFIYDTGAEGGLFVSFEPTIDSLVPDWRTRVMNINYGGTMGVGGVVLPQDGRRRHDVF